MARSGVKHARCSRMIGHSQIAKRVSPRTEGLLMSVLISRAFALVDDKVGPSAGGLGPESRGDRLDGTG
jgi:hypothetical protein